MVGPLGRRKTIRHRSVTTENRPRLFFPNGIDLIKVELEAGLHNNPLVKVTAQIAGEKCCSKGLVEELDGAPVSGGNRDLASSD